jgi:hypothetical protein
MVVLLTMLVLFFSAGPLSETWNFWEYYHLGTVAAYRLTYLTYMVVSAAMVTGLWSRYAFASDALELRVSFALMTTGGVSGLGYLANDAGVVFGALGWHPFSWWGDTGLSDLLISLAIILVVAGAMMPVWGRVVQAVRAHLAFLRLRGLWLQLRAACPTVALLPERPLWKDALNLGDASFRLHRQVVEIRDATYALAAFAHPRSRRVASEIAASLCLHPEDQLALEEAARLQTGLESLRRGKSEEARRADDRPEPVHHVKVGREGFWGEVSHLTRVAKHVAGSAAMRATLHRLAQAGEVSARTSPSSGAECQREYAPRNT